MNLLQYVNKSETINNKLNSLLSQINYDYQNGNIRTETEYYYRIKNMINDFYKSLTMPSFQYRPAVSTPISSEYNAMITESYNDLAYIIKDCETLQRLVLQSFTDAELSRTMMTNSLKYLSKKVEGIGQSIATGENINNVVFTELFNSTNNMGNIDDPNACMINVNDGILTLKTTMNSSVTFSNVEIDDDYSNGFPGNTHCVDTLNNDLHFIGQEGLHLNINQIADGNNDTWFEYELFDITDETRQKCNSFGFEYDEGVSWINHKDPLKLKIIMTLNSETTCTWLSLTPYLSNIKGVKNCIIETCDVISASNNIYRVANNLAFDDVLVFPFPPQPVKKIVLTLIQPYKYQTTIGHYYYTAANTTDMSIFQQYDYTDLFARVDGKKPSVGLLGVKYNPKTQWIKYADSNTELPSEKYIKSSLFRLPETTIEKKSNQEMIDAYRYFIGIRNIKMSSCNFAEFGQYVSCVYHTEEVITSVCLEANEYIPGDDVNILRYYISLNGGINWHQIYPIHRSYQGVYKYYINNDSIKNLLTFEKTSHKTKNLVIAGECHSIQLKIEMDRPVHALTSHPDSVHEEICNASSKTQTFTDKNGNTSVQYHFWHQHYNNQWDENLPIDCNYVSPIVYDYKLRLTTGGETIEY